ncbi:MAG: NnrS family protein [Comamonadaceae bacterium]
MTHIPILKILEPTAPAPRGAAFLRLGFRPFYLGAAVLAAFAVPLWMMVFLGQWVWAPALSPLLWHAHEMLLGFASAVIIGFLLTAVKAWTGLATPRGWPLAALALLWLSARIAALTAPYPVFAVLDTLLLPIVAMVLVRLLLRADNTRNLPLAGLLLLLSAANTAFHLSVLGLLDLAPTSALHAALAVIVMVECVMAGRVIPGFSMSAIPGLRITTLLWLERSALGLTALGLLLWVLTAPAAVTSLALGLAAAAHVWRQWRWKPLLTKQRPILWILHLSYAWIPIGLGLLALAQIHLLAVSLGLHALAVGTTGGLIIGMITRTARGHTGRTLQVAPAEVLAYVLVSVAAALRVLLPLLWPDLLLVWLTGAAAAWSVAFAIYVFVYTPWLTQTRLDGKDG